MDKDRDKTSECYGAVYIKINETTFPVCASTWTKENAEVVCKELNCGKVSFHCGERQKKKKRFVGSAKKGLKSSFSEVQYM